MALKPAGTVQSIINDRSQIRLSDIQTEFDGSTEELALSIYHLIQNGRIEIQHYNDVIRIEHTEQEDTSDSGPLYGSDGLVLEGQDTATNP